MLEPPVTPIRKANDGLELPATGFGTYKVNGLTGVDAIKSAIHQGYRLIDSAFNYENEGVVGRAIRESGVPREDIIVTSKLPGRHHAHDEALLTIEESVCRMGLDYIDLYLIHWPNPSQGQFVEANPCNCPLITRTMVPGTNSFGANSTSSQECSIIVLKVSI